MMKIEIKRLVHYVFFVGLILCGTSSKSQVLSEAHHRFITKYQSHWNNKLPDNPTIDLKYEPVRGINYTTGVVRRDPSDIIKIDHTYYIWYTRSITGGPLQVGPREANDSLRAYPWDLAEIWYATSKDRKTWQEIGPAIHRGPIGTFDARSVFTPNILVAKGKYYLFYQTAQSLADAVKGDFKNTLIGMSWSNSPNGPWIRNTKPVLKPGNYGDPGNYPQSPILVKGDWDGLIVHDPSLIEMHGKYYLYYKSRYFRGSDESFASGELKNWVEKDGGIPIGWGIAIANKPEGPYIKSKFNPVLIGGHECIIWPYKNGVCALMAQGPERNSIQFASDGINFHVINYVKKAPIAAGVFREDYSTPGTLTKSDKTLWGISHVVTDSSWPYLRYFELNQRLNK